MQKLKILFIGDVAGRVGRRVVNQVLPDIRKQYKPDLVIANVENAAGGHGVNLKVIEELLESGVDLCTGGDHTFSVKSFYDELLVSPEIDFIRPANYTAKDLPGKGYKIVELGSKGRVAVISMLGGEFLNKSEKVDNPFWFANEYLQLEEIANADVRIIDFHAETTAEKLSFAWYVREQVQAVLGTHTHVATADNRILGEEVAYVTDVGQVGPYEASLWVDFDTTIHNFMYPNRKSHKLAEAGPQIFNSVLVTFENFSPKKIDRVDVVLE